MSKSKKNRAAATNRNQHKSKTSSEVFSFGDPVPVLDRRELLDYVECVQMDRWYEPPSALTDWRVPSAPPCITAPR